MALPVSSDEQTFPTSLLGCLRASFTFEFDDLCRGSCGASKLGIIGKLNVARK